MMKDKDENDELKTVKNNKEILYLADILLLKSQDIEKK